MVSIKAWYPLVRLFSLLWKFSDKIITLVGIWGQHSLILLFHSRAMWNSNEYQRVLISIALPHKLKERNGDDLPLSSRLLSYYYFYNNFLSKVSNKNTRITYVIKQSWHPNYAHLHSFTLKWEEFMLGCFS